MEGRSARLNSVIKYNAGDCQKAWSQRGVDPEFSTRSEWIHRERLGLAPEDHHLLADAEPRALRAPRVLGAGPFVGAWRNYLKNLLRPTFFFAFEAKPAVLFYVLENKTLAGREGRSEEDHQEAPGRKLTLVFFERAAELPGHARRVDRGSSAMQPLLLTLAELLHTCELGPPLDATKTATEQEVLAEAHYANLPLTRFKGEETEGDERYLFLLGDGSNAEDAYVSDPERILTKMVLARRLQTTGALALGETLNSAWNQTLATLQGRAAAWLPAVAPPGGAPRGGRGGGGGDSRRAGGGRRGGRGRGRGRA